jgi:hypothetical protein
MPARSHTLRPTREDRIAIIPSWDIGISGPLETVISRRENVAPRVDTTETLRAVDEPVSVHQNSQEPKIDGYVSWDQNSCIVFDARSPISSNSIDIIKLLYIICIHIIFLIFVIHPTNSTWLKL